MKTNQKFFLSAVCLLSAFALTSCDENATIDVPGPDVKFTFNYEDIQSAAPAQRGTSVWVPVVSQTVPGEDVVAFLEKDSTNKQYAEAIVAASLKNGELSVTGGDGSLSFAGVDSVKIIYKVTGASVENVLVTGAPESGIYTTVHFSDIKISKDQALEMIKSEKLVTLMVKYDPTNLPNCFVPGAVYNFTANSVLSVKASSLTSGLF